MNKELIINNKLNDLSRSKFRSTFKLKEKDILYIKKVGINKINEHAYDFINQRLKIKLVNDGKQTPMKGHPVFIAQHATGTCCRKCLYKWHHIPEDKVLSNNEINYVVSLIMMWIINNMKN